MYNTDLVIIVMLVMNIIAIIYINRKNNISIKLSKEYLAVGNKIADNLYEVNKAVRTLKNSLMLYNNTMLKLNDTIEDANNILDKNKSKLD